MNKTILVTGGAGFIGSNFVEIALQKSYKIIVLDAFTYAGHEASLAFAKGNPNFHLVKGDICDAPLVYKLLTTHNVDAVINFAAESHVDNSINSPGVFIKTNVDGVYSMLEASRKYFNGLPQDKKQAFRFIQVSTDEVYGSLELDDPTKFSETSQYKPSSPYSASKAAGDHLAHAWFKTYGLPTIVTNCSNNYGPRQFPEKLIPRMIECALNGKNLPVYGDGKNVRDWIHVHDHAGGILLALNAGIPGETYCFGGDAEVANIDLVQQLCSALDELWPLSDGEFYNKNITFIADRAGHDRRYAIDDSKAEKQLGFTRQYNFTSGLKSTIKWYLDNQEWCEEVSSSS